MILSIYPYKHFPHIMALFGPKVRKSYPVNSERSCIVRGDFASAVVSSVLNSWTAGVEAKMEAWCNGWWHGDSTWWCRAKISMACIGGASR
ncbi:unnamed protein product [Blepharisma stoltei]|uniref:Uncharacterized protein n=1 Tax=Blepharisma stoltei TaxID=1481888 RepID=A0AAU9J5I6_9CILI|nr:unnamed protein product [Blepharisma stoltei]